MFTTNKQQPKMLYFFLQFIMCCSIKNKKIILCETKRNFLSVFKSVPFLSDSAHRIGKFAINIFYAILFGSTIELD